MSEKIYAAFKSRGHRLKEGKYHAYRLNDDPTSLDDYKSLCGTTHGRGTIAAMRFVDCRKCIDIIKKETLP